ncbi:MAG: hypothetical protein KJN71_03015 [Acidimicrobiia bacterium]|nr:hypothetical protein [Acidimicrobiia bacterium]
MQRLTGLQRIFNPLKYQTHRTIVVIGIASGALALAVGNDFIEAFWSGIAAGLAWAIARELHPDSEMAGLAAGVIAGAFQALVGGVGLGVCYLLIVFLRIIVRTTGKAPTTIDLVLNVVVVAFVSNTLPGFLASLGVALALFLSPALPNPSPQQHRIWSFAYAGMALVGLVFSPPPEAPDPSGATWLLFSVSMLASVGLLQATRPRSVGDIDGEPLNGARLRLGRIELVALLIVLTVTTLGAGVIPAAPAFAAVLATGVVGVRDLVSS